jgi:hypothetical protein
MSRSLSCEVLSNHGFLINFIAKYLSRNGMPGGKFSVPEA